IVGGGGRVIAGRSRGGKKVELAAGSRSGSHPRLCNCDRRERDRDVGRAFALPDADRPSQPPIQCRLIVLAPDGEPDKHAHCHGRNEHSAEMGADGDHRTDIGAVSVDAMNSTTTTKRRSGAANPASADGGAGSVGDGLPGGSPISTDLTTT